MKKQYWISDLPLVDRLRTTYETVYFVPIILYTKSRVLMIPMRSISVISGEWLELQDIWKKYPSSYVKANSMPPTA